MVGFWKDFRAQNPLILALFSSFFGCFFEVKKHERKNAPRKAKIWPKSVPGGFDLATTPRHQATGKGREGVNPFPGTGIGGLIVTSTRPEAQRPRRIFYVNIST